MCSVLVLRWFMHYRLFIVFHYGIARAPVMFSSTATRYTTSYQLGPTGSIQLSCFFYPTLHQMVLFAFYWCGKWSGDSLMPGVVPASMWSKRPRIRVTIVWYSSSVFPDGDYRVVLI